MDLSKALKRGYFIALNDGLNIPVYDAFAIPERVDYPFVIISQINTAEIPRDKCKLYSAEVTLDIVTGFSSPTGMDAAFDIAEDIEDIINASNGADLNIIGTGWNIGETRLIQSNSVQLRSANYWIYRNVRTYSHIISKTLFEDSPVPDDPNAPAYGNQVSADGNFIYIYTSGSWHRSPKDTAYV